ncbi:unnamed protein product [Mytilus edulis]|uniref:Uncharacterized protein n=1 Tax=Mytilus edulis TaxID=6550 RepID=A0A8S3QCW2_MYTED|nr:unnamed protein product [Mytilus edulis]
MLFPGNSRWNKYLAGPSDRSSSSTNEMTVRRSRYSSVPPGYFASTKGHSALKRWSYAPQSRSALYEDTYIPEVIRPRSYYDTSREENDIRRGVNDELVYTSNLMDDTYDVAAKSRSRDQMLLRDAARALPSTMPAIQDKKTTSLTPARRFSPRSTSSITPSCIKKPIAYPRLAPPIYRGTTNVQPLGILTKLDWTSPLRKYQIPELYNGDDVSEISSYTTPTQSERSSPERDDGTGPRRYKARRLPHRKVGNYYKQLVQRRAVRPGTNPRYYPYLDVESIASNDDLVSNGEYRDDDDDYQDYQSVTDGGDGDYYYVNRERSPSPIEYIPFGPRSRMNFDSDDYKCQVPSMTDYAVSHYHPSKKEPDFDPDKSRIKDDLVFHDVVAHTAHKAREALKHVDLDQYDNASLVISVEGEYKDPIKGENMGFHYIARPLTLKGPMLAGPATYASTASDSAFSRYMDDSRAFRAEVRNRLETGYKTLSEITSKYKGHSYPIITSSHRNFSRALSPVRGSSYIPRSSSPVRYSSESLPISNLRKRLEDIENRFKASGYGKRLDTDITDSLVVFPVSQKEGMKALNDHLPGHANTVELYQGSAKGTELSTLEKINIKVTGNDQTIALFIPFIFAFLTRNSIKHDVYNIQVDTETYVSPRSSVTSNRVRATSVVARPAPLTSRAVSCPPTSRRSNQAALVGNKVEISTPHRRRPKSNYAANKMRELKREEREYEVEAIPTQITTGLKATTVSPLYGGKSHWDEEGHVTKPKNLMSWKYRIESRVPPGDYFFPIKTIGHVREKLLHVKEQMDRHKQLMDRYLPNEDTDTDVKTKIMNMYVDMEQHNPYLFRRREGLLTTKSCENSPPSSILRSPTPRRAASVQPTATLKPSDGYQPMSDVRRRVRRVICKNRGNPRFFKTD